VDWQDSDWFIEWERLARKEYQGKTDVPLFYYLVTKEGEALSSLGKRMVRLKPE
jgi:hypothetical protein